MIAIRAASLQDAVHLPEIERRSGAIFRQWPGLEWIADDDVQSVESHRTLICEGVALVAEEQGRGTVGFLNGELTSDGLHIWQAAVHQEFQRRGIGRQLILAARQIAAQSGASAVSLTTFRKVPWNEPYYQRLGFRTLPESALTPRLREILECERRAGLPVEERCAMILEL